MIKSHLLLCIRPPKNHRTGGKGKGKGKGKREHAGVGMLISRDMESKLISIEQINSRIMRATFNTTPNITVISAYAPPADAPEQDKDQFYETLEHTQNTTQATKPQIILGYFNARLHGRHADEARNIGPHIDGRGLTYLETTPPTTKENRATFIHWVHTNDHIVHNTWFEQPHTSSSPTGNRRHTKETTTQTPRDTTKLTSQSHQGAGETWSQTPKHTPKQG